MKWRITDERKALIVLSLMKMINVTNFLMVGKVAENIFGSLEHHYFMIGASMTPQLLHHLWQAS